MKNYYQILEVPESASDSEIKSAFRKLAKKFHPDKNPDDAAAEKRFKEISEAYDVLSDSEKKNSYDNQLKYGGNPFSGMGFDSGGFGDLGSIFETLFGGGRRTNRRSSRSNSRRDYINRDLRILVNIDFFEAINGCNKTVEFSRPIYCDPCAGLGINPSAKPISCRTCNATGRITQRQGPMVVQITCHDCSGQGMKVVPCNSCSGRGYNEKNEKLNFSVPAGVNSGQVIRLSQKGEHVNPNRASGNLMIEISVPETHSGFYRKDLHIYSEETVDFIKSALGRSIEVKTIHGLKILEIPRGCAPESTLVIAGAGVESGNKKGDHYVKLKVTFPVVLSADQEDLLTQLESTFGS